MDTIFMTTPGFDESRVEQVFVGLMSRMINVYPMPSKASIHIYQAYQDFMRYEGAPEGLHRDMAPEEKVEKITNLNRDMMVKDTFAEPGHPNQNPAENLGVKPLKTGAEKIMNRTGADDRAWPWVHKYIADINNHCATPLLGWKTPISVRHGHTPDISAFLQFKFWEKVYYKVEGKHPNSKEAAGRWMGVSNTVGDELTYVIWTDKTHRVVSRSVVRSADAKKGGTPKFCVPSIDDNTNMSDEEEGYLELATEEVNAHDLPTQISKPARNGKCTAKHKTQPTFHNALEPPPDLGFHDAKEPPPDFGFHDTSEATKEQCAPKKRGPGRPKKVKRGPGRPRKVKSGQTAAIVKAHLIHAAACLSLASGHTTMTTTIFDSGCNMNSLQCNPLFSHVSNPSYHVHYAKNE
jgi:hypothetical protein